MHAAPLQIDMDTIETSNLNRQFLFRRRHVGESKAKIAAEAVKRFRPAANIVSHQVFALRPNPRVNLIEGLNPPLLHLV